MQDLLQQAGSYTKRNKKRRTWRKILSVLACAVVFCTTYALILPAITMEGDTFCGLEEHTHTEDCYVQADAKTLPCTVETLQVHVHTADCYDASGKLRCGEADYILHTHDSSCYDAQGNLICTLPEVEEHTHIDACYTMQTSGHTHSDSCYSLQRGNLTCEVEEAEGHSHGESCYTLGTEPVCGLEEGADHTHTESCYEKLLTCTLSETEGHTHTDACYEQKKVLTCGMEETGDSTETVLVCTKAEIAYHKHTDACYTGTELTCGKLQVLRHIHDESCTAAADASELTCTEPESETHQHNFLCYGTWELTCTQEEHTHDLSCYSDPTADLETEAVWEKTFADVKLTGDWAANVMAIAETQLGYQESTKNYEVLEDGETIRGYTRYGAWYGDPYGDWCAMFVSFCLHYAETEEIPLDGSCSDWVTALSKEDCDLYRDAEEYEPQPGDLVFFNIKEDEKADHVGIVAEVIEATENEPAKIKVIEGNSNESVQKVTYKLTDSTILGYMDLTAASENFYAKYPEVRNVIELIDEMPSADEIDAQLTEFEEAEDYENEEAWYTAVVQQVAAAYHFYSELSEEEKELVINDEKLLELEYIWSVTTYVTGITSDKPTTVQAASTSDFVDLNLYDYNSAVNTNYYSNSKYPGFQWNGGAYVYYNSSGENKYTIYSIDGIDFGNSMITDYDYVAGSNPNGKSASAVGVAKTSLNYSSINSLVEWPSGDYANKPVGFSMGGTVLSNTLIDGYPALSDGTSLKEYFSNSTFATKQNTSSIDGLFQIEDVSGEYYYNSRLNHAQYSNNKFTLYNQIITPNFITYPFGNFLPFNTITDSTKATQVSKINRVVQGGNSGYTGYIQTIINRLLEGTEDATENQLIDMLARYRNTLGDLDDYDSDRYTWTAADAINSYFHTASGDNPSDAITFSMDDELLQRMYNIDWDVDTNFFFGMDMTMNFIQPKGGYTGNDTNKDGESDYPMVFYFTGDDDVWVYIDGVLFLDLSGIHRHVGGEIDFVNGVVKYYALDTKNTGDVSTTPYQTYTFAEILKAAGKSTDGLNSSGTFADYTTHQFKFYYMERGSGSSVCRLNFNFPLLRQNSISVSKEVSSDTEILGNPDYSFQVLKANSNGTKTSDLFIAAGTTYTIYDANDNVIGTGTTDANGVFTLKAGQRAEFTGISENAGKYYVRELLEGTVLGQYGKVTVSGESTTTSNNVTVGSETFTGMDSPVKDMSDGATAFRFTNDVDENKLGVLNISKVLTEYSKTRDVKYFDIEVTLDDEKLPVGTTYTVGTETRTVTTAGIITIAADETATIKNILAGTAFTVKETSGSAEGYTVTYNDSGGYTITVKDGIVSGVIKTSANVQLVVTNAEKGATVTIPGVKSLNKSDGEEHTFTFELNEVTDSTGSTLKTDGVSNYTTTAEITDTGQFSFSINYVQTDQTTLPAKFYYRITEQADDSTLINSTAYVVEVTVSEAADGITAAVTGMWKDGTAITDYSADFTNTLTGSLSLEKKVAGSAADEAGKFSFTIRLEPGESGLDALPETYLATYYNADGSTKVVTETLQDGAINLTMSGGEKLILSGIPYGAAWFIEETNSAGYVVTATVNGESAVLGDTKVTSGSITTGETAVVYTNTVYYELPKTGGTGTNLYTTGGLLLTLAAGILLYIHRRRRKEDPASS